MRSKLLLAHFIDDETDSERLKIIVIICQGHTAKKWQNHVLTTGLRSMELHILGPREDCEGWSREI